jgi:hypothetical protein
MNIRPYGAKIFNNFADGFLRMKFEMARASLCPTAHSVFCFVKRLDFAIVVLLYLTLETFKISYIYKYLLVWFYLPRIKKYLHISL